MLAVLYHKSTGPTGRALAKVLKADWKGRDPRITGQRVGGLYDLVLRWGSSAAFPARVELNPAAAIKQSADKLRSYHAFAEAGVSIIPFTDIYEEARSWGEVLVYGRHRYGSGGKDISLFEQGVQPGIAFPLYTKGIRIHREYRVHVVGDAVIKVQGKYLDIPEDDKSGGRVCNHANGYRFKTPQQTLHKQRTDDAIKAVKALGLDFGAVDLIIGQDKKHYILEVNTGPACAPATLQAYTTALTRLIEERT